VEINRIEIEAGRVVVCCDDGSTDTVTALWLRDACHCVECRGDCGGQRRFDMAGVDPSTTVDEARLDGDRVVTRFSDGHIGTVPLSALSARRPHGVVPTWGADHASVLADRSVDVAATTDLGPMIDGIDRHGIGMARNAPLVDGEVARFADRLGHVRVTNYGRIFDVRAEPDPANLANSTVGLPFHTDNPYRDPRPTVQLLHCLVSSGEGGATLFVDGFRAANHLAAADTDAFAMLTGTDLRFRFSDHDVDLRARGPMLETDASGAVIAVRINNRSMEPPDLPADSIDAFYAAYRAFVALIDDPDGIVSVMMQPGDLVAFDNRRVLHSRTAYSPTTHRHLQGCYADIDAIRSASVLRSGAGR